MSSDFSGKTAVIVGVANKRSLAWAIAQGLHAAGARLVLTYQNERLGENVQELAATLDPSAILLPCDVSSDAQVASLFSEVERLCDGVDLLVHGAAFAPREALTAPFHATSRDAFQVALDVSAYSLVALARAAAPSMERKGAGSILTLTYLGSQRVFPNYNVMGVAKAALEAAVRYLAADLGPRNIRVNAISAGPVKTLAASGIAGFSQILEIYRSRAALRRNIEAAEVAGPALFLLGPASRAITGEVLTVDCGFSITGM
jgi:enoyl-[acyl-carrier protein] reductase I